MESMNVIVDESQQNELSEEEEDEAVTSHE